jgi:hypothetical protein
MRVYDLQRGSALTILLARGDKASKSKAIVDVLMRAINLNEEI